MRAVWYDRTGPAREVLQYGDRPLPLPAPGEVRVKLLASGVNPADTYRRAGTSYANEFPLIVPNSDGAGFVEALGEGADPTLLGRRVWLYNAQRCRPFGTAAEDTCVPARIVHDLPEDVAFEVGACLGIPGMTAHRCLFADGPVAGCGCWSRAVAARWATTRCNWPGGAARRGCWRRRAAAGRARTRDGRGAGRIRLPRAGLRRPDHGSDRRRRRGPHRRGRCRRQCRAVVQRDRAERQHHRLCQPRRADAADPGLRHADAEERQPARRGAEQRACRRAAAGDGGHHTLAARGTRLHRVAASFPLAETAAAHEAVEAGTKRGTVVVLPQA